MQNYTLLIERISKSSGLSAEEVERKVEAKKAKLSGLISKEGAAQIIAAELGISFENQDLKISELLPGMKKINIIGKIINIFSVREYDKNGRSGKVANFILADETGNLRVVLWDNNHISMIESEKLKAGDVVEIKNGTTREGEIHLSAFSELLKSDKKIDDVKTEREVSEESLDKIRQGQSVTVRGTIVQFFQPRFYLICPQCNKKVVQAGEKISCAEHGAIKPKERAILNFVIDDGNEAVRAVLFSEQINLLIPEEDLKDEVKASQFKDDILGSEVYVTGVVKRNQLFNNLEIIVSNIERVDVEKLIERLEGKN
ncbi:MAG: OB-fold nucleic acid binding domain-containing protein [Candidatus Pacearchaeota archaeon]